ncbi:unnamed protein product [Symbiodinium natans]|uniref:Uncharacterized protein n=1 Tax=Symbiodinium natans TaxID=878477 RepID=A0A812GN55_9DINO|nr:unnamed protein product [Symbiodinium natans]
MTVKENAETFWETGHCEAKGTGVLDGLEAISDVLTAPGGLGFLNKPSKIAVEIARGFALAAEFDNNMQTSAETRLGIQAGDQDCGPLAYGLARMFCDLHCIRNVVKQGDAAILSSLQQGVEFLQTEMRTLFYVYFRNLGADSTASLLQQTSEIRSGIARDVQEMHSMLQADLRPSAETAAHRAIRTFTTATREGLQDRRTNATSTLQFISQKVSALHATMKLVSTQSAAASTTVERRTAAYVAKMNEVLRAETQTLGLYTRDASTSRLRQSKLSQRALQDDLRELSLKFALRTLDESWWNLRSSLDRYLDAYDVYLRSFKQAVSMLDRYTQCGATFKDLKQAYSASKRGHDLEQQTLREAWTAAVPAIGLMAAQVVDTRMLQELAIDDAAKMMAKITADGKNAQRLCQKDAALLLDIAQAAFKQGLFAQTVWQFHTLFDEMTMLRRRFARSRSVPDETALHAAEAAWGT